MSYAKVRESDTLGNESDMVIINDFERVIEDTDRVTDGWISMFVTAAEEVMVAEHFVSRYSDDPALSERLSTAWRKYRRVCRKSRKIVLPKDVIPGLARLIFFQVIPAALAETSKGSRLAVHLCLQHIVSKPPLYTGN